MSSRDGSEVTDRGGSDVAESGGSDVADGASVGCVDEGPEGPEGAPGPGGGCVTGYDARAQRSARSSAMASTGARSPPARR